MIFTCIKCSQEKPKSEFYQTPKLRRGHYSTCKQCWDERSRAFRKNNAASCYATRKKYRNSNRARVAALTRKSALKQRYGITESQYAELMRRQNGACALCGATTELCVDHCHTSGVVRGLLCQKCNRGIGCFNDNPALILKAAEFIKAATECLTSFAPSPQTTGEQA